MDIDYLESLFTGMDIIINERLKDLPYDKTIICTVVNNDNRKNYEYTVSDGSIEFIAYSENDRFLKGDQVLVKIPQGDYTKEKIIEGKYLNKDNVVPTTYISPLDTVVNMTGNLIQSDDNTLWGIKANGELLEDQIWYKTFDSKPLSLITENGIADTITLKADFKTLLSNFNKGNYGLRLDVCTKKDEDKNELILDSYFLDNSEMFGDPYNFLVYTQQEKTFDIITYGYIYLLRLVLYQKGNFEPFEKSSFYNIFVKDIELGIGSDVIKIEDNTLKIYSADNLDYSSNNSKKNIGLTWYNKDDNNKYIGFSDGIYDSNYSERDYLKVVAADARLLAQQGRKDIPNDKESLTLAANIEEGKQGVKKALNLISKDIHQELINLILQLDDIEDLKSSVREFNDQTLKNYYSNINDELVLVEEDYKSTLKWRYDKVEKETKPSLKGSLSGLKGYFESFDTEIKNMFSGLLESIESNYKGYEGIYETYKIRVEKILVKIDKIINNLVFFETDKDEEGSIFFIDQKRLEKETIENEVFEKSEYTEYANKYDIYWYRYNKDASGDEFMSDGWEELTELAGVGLPDEEGETGFYQKSLAAGTYTEIEMNGNQTEEKIIVILFYNHIMYKSNELVFSNTDKVKALTDQGDAIIIQHHDESYNDYYIYNLTGVLNNIGDSSKVRRLRCHYDGLLAKDEILQNAEIYWYVPIQNSMIVVNQKTLKNKGFSTDIENTLLIPGYDCYHKTIKLEKDENENENIKEIDDRDFYYLINSYYMETASNNNIICKVKLADTDNYLQAQVSLSFGTSGTSGTQYNLIAKEAEPNKISTTDNIIASDGSLVLDGSLALDISLRDYQNEKIPIYKGNSTGNNLATIDPEQGCKWLINMSDIVDPIELLFNSNNLDEFIGAKIPASSYGILNTIITFANPSQDSKLINLQPYHPVPWSTSLNYYISGPVRIIYNSLGTLDDRSIYDKKYQLFNYLTNEEITDIEWVIEYYVITDGKSIKLDENDTFYNNYMPKLVNNTLVPASLYLDELDCYALVKALKDNEVQWIQPIVIAQNKYTSSLLNDWKGSFQINEESGTILSTMVGAGRKTSDNTFSGVLMGDVGVASGDNKTGLGLYGFHEGAQSFCFNVDGTAFLGKSGGGRILFDGNKGVISSPGWVQEDKQWSCDSLTGTLIDLDDAQLLLKGKNGYLYFNDNNDGILKMSLSGANIILTDKENKGLSTYIDATAEGIITEVNDSINGVNSKIEQTASKIDAKVSKFKDGKENGFGWNLQDDGFVLTSTIDEEQTDVFKANKDGIVVTGTVNATDGAIGGWELDKDEEGFSRLYSGSHNFETDTFDPGFIGLFTGYLHNDLGYRLVIGPYFSVDQFGKLKATGVEISGNSKVGGFININDKFKVDSNGNMTATSVNITGGEMNINNKFKVDSNGVLTATGADIQNGSIGGWKLTSTSLTSGSGQGFIGLYTSYPTNENYRLKIGTNIGIDSDGDIIFTTNGKIFFGNDYSKYIGFSGDNGSVYINGPLRVSESISSDSGSFFGKELNIDVIDSSNETYVNFPSGFQVKGQYISNYIENCISGASGTFYAYSPDNTYQHTLEFENGLLVSYS